MKATRCLSCWPALMAGDSQNQEQHEDARIKALSLDQTLCVPLQLHYNGFAL